MGTKITTIKLVVKNANIEQEFSVDHAERLLNMGIKNNGGWQLPDNSEYCFSKENGIRLKQNKREPKKAQ